MDSRKMFASFAFALAGTLVWAAVCQAGFAIRLEKEVPQSSVTSVNPIVASIFASQTAVDPVATQTFRVSDLTLSMVESVGGEPIYRLRLDFTETDALTIAMDLYWEFSLGGTKIGKREKVPQSAASIFSVEAVTAGNADEGQWEIGEKAPLELELSPVEDDGKQVWKLTNADGESVTFVATKWILDDRTPSN